MCDVNYQLRAELCAHTTLCRDKPFHRNFATRLKFCNSGSDFTDGYRTCFKFGLPLDAGFKLHRTVREFEVHQGQPGGRVAQRF